MDRNLPADIKRSQNDELHQGTVDGLVMRLRPNTSRNTDTAHAADRAAHLDDKIHGNMGVGSPDASAVIFDKPLR